MKKRKTWNPDNMKSAILAIRSKKMGYKEASEYYNVPKATLKNKSRTKEDNLDKLVGTKLGRKPVFSEAMEQSLVSYCLEMNRTSFITFKDLKQKAFQLAVENNVPNSFSKEKEKAGKKWLQCFLKRHPEISLLKLEENNKTFQNLNRPTDVCGLSNVNDDVAFPLIKGTSIDHSVQRTTIKRKTWDPENMKKAIIAVRKKEMGYEKASKYFNVPKSTLENKCRSEEGNLDKLVNVKLGRKPVFSEAVEQSLVSYCLEMNRISFITFKDLKKKAFQLALDHNVPNKFSKKEGKAGQKWLQCFLKRHPELCLEKGKLKLT